MKKAAITLVSLLAATAALAGHVERREKLSIPTAGASRLVIDHALGTLIIEGDDVTDVEVEMKVVCGTFRFNCEERAEWVELSHRGWGDTLRLSVEGYPDHGPGLSVDLVVRVPRHIGVEVDRGVGDTTIRGISGDIDVEAGVGDLDIRMNAKDVRTLRIESGVGGADLRVNGRRKGRKDGFLFLGNEIDWHGDGESRVDIELGVGSVEVNLD